MSLEFNPLFITPLFTPQPLTLSLILLFLLLSLLSLFLSPGGFAWSLSRFFLQGRPSPPIPGPSGLPVLGLAFAFTPSSLPYRILHRLSNVFNARTLMAFSVGSSRFIISSEPETARELLNSPVFADRPIKESAYGLLFHRAMGFAPYGEYWRNLRRLSSSHLFCPRMISRHMEFRHESGVNLVKQINRAMDQYGAVEVRSLLHFVSLNNVMKTVFGKSYDLFGSGNEQNGLANELESLVGEGYDLLGVFNWSDHFPILGWFDLQGIRKRCKKLVVRVNDFVGKIIEEHRVKKENVKGGKLRNSEDDDRDGDFVDVLLNLEKENKLSNSDIIAVLWEMIFRGTDTIAILLEWILARMVLHPDIQAKAQAEIDSVVGLNRPVSDTDLPHLPYMHAIMKETLRMHPPGPLLSWARLAIHDTTIGQYFIPAGTTAMVNMWAITHDNRVWSNPEEFRPERFIEEDVHIMGSDLRLAPFGSGRRVCPGRFMGLAIVELWLAQLLQNFKWVPKDHHGVDLSECIKLSMEMKHSLVCKAVSRDVLVKNNVKFT